MNHSITNIVSIVWNSWTLKHLPYASGTVGSIVIYSENNFGSDSALNRKQFISLTCSLFNIVPR